MFGLVAAVALCTLSGTTAAYRPHGTAPSSTTSSITTLHAFPNSTLSSSVPGTATSLHPPFPIYGSGSVTRAPARPRPTSASLASLASPLVSSNSAGVTSTDVTSTDTKTTNDKAANSKTTNSSCTVNIVNANLEWWYAATYAYPLGTFTAAGAAAANFTSSGRYLTVIPHDQPFDPSSAITTDTVYTEREIYDSEFDFYWTLYEEYDVTPTAASTSVITRYAPPPLPSASIIPETDTAKYQQVFPVPPAIVSIAAVSNSTSAVTSATPFLYFTAYEIESAANGTIDTKTVTLDQPSAIEYSVKGLENSPSATGSVPEDFLQQIPESTCNPGSVQGSVTVLVVLDLFFTNMIAADPFIIHFESSVSGFETLSDTVLVQGVSTDEPFVLNGNPDPTANGEGKSTANNEAQSQNTEFSQTGFENTSKGPQPPQTGAAPAQTLNIVQPTSVTVGTIGTNPIVVAPSSAVIIGTQSLQPGGPAVTIDGTLVSLAPSATAIVVGATTSALPAKAAPGSSPQTVGTIGGSPVIVSSSSVLVGTEVLKPGGPAVTISGTPVSLDPSATSIFIGGTTSPLPVVASPGSPSQIVGMLAGIPVIVGPSSAIILGTQTLQPGGPAITLGGHLVSLAPLGTALIVEGQTSLLPHVIFPGEPFPTQPPVPLVITVGSSTITAISGNPFDQVGDSPGNDGSGPTFVISGQTLTHGHAITVDSSTISLGPSGSFIVINGVTSTLHAQNPAITNPPLLTIGSQIHTAEPGLGTSFIISGQILTPGGVVTVDGTTISLAGGATLLVYGSAGQSTTTTLSPATTPPTGKVQSTPAPSDSARTGASRDSGEAAPSTSSVGGAAGVGGFLLPEIETWMLSLIAWGLGGLL